MWRLSLVMTARKDTTAGGGAGTGDTQLTIAQRARISGAVVVSTPQEIALMDVKKGIRMFQKLGVPILGMVENMSGFRCTRARNVAAALLRDLFRLLLQQYFSV